MSKKSSKIDTKIYRLHKYFNISTVNHLILNLILPFNCQRTKRISKVFHSIQKYIDFLDFIAIFNGYPSNLLWKILRQFQRYLGDTFFILFTEGCAIGFNWIGLVQTNRCQLLPISFQF